MEPDLRKKGAEHRTLGVAESNGSPTPVGFFVKSSGPDRRFWVTTLQTLGDDGPELGHLLCDDLFAVYQVCGFGNVFL